MIKVHATNIIKKHLKVSYDTYIIISLAISFVLMGKKHKKFIDLDLAEKIALRIKELRDEYGHTQEFLIEKVHLDINRYEICDRIPTLMSLRKICDFYNITLAEFFISMNYPPKTGKIIERMSSKE